MVPVDHFKRRTDDGQQADVLPGFITPQFQSKQKLRYGENPHQPAAFYIESGTKPVGIAAARQLQGKETLPGNDMQLTIDLDLQLEAENALTTLASYLAAKNFVFIQFCSFIS